MTQECWPKSCSKNVDEIDPRKGSKLISECCWSVHNCQWKRERGRLIGLTFDLILTEKLFRGLILIEPFSREHSANLHCITINALVDFCQGNNGTVKKYYWIMLKMQVFESLSQKWHQHFAHLQHMKTCFFNKKNLWTCCNIFVQTLISHSLSLALSLLLLPPPPLSLSLSHTHIHTLYSSLLWNEKLCQLKISFFLVSPNFPNNFLTW